MDTQPTALEPHDVVYFQRGAWENPRFWSRLSRQSDPAGKRAL
jgi:hypothetical protein